MVKKVGLLAALLLIAGSCACAQDWSGLVKKGDLDAVKSTVAQKPEIVHKKTGNGTTALHIAAERGDVAMAGFLLENRADPNVRDKMGATPVHVAAAFGKDSIARLLLQKGANPNAKKKDGVTPLMVAANFGYVPVGKVLHEFNADLVAKDNKGRTALSIAVDKRQTAFADWLRPLVPVGDGTGSILVKVIDPSGKPIAQAEVSAGYGTAGQITNDRGEATLTGLDPGNYTVTASKPLYGSASRDTMVSPGSVTPLEIPLSPEFGTLSGTFKDAGGSPIEGADVKTFPGDNSTMTGPGGRFSMQVSPNTSYSVVASKPGGDAAIKHNIRVDGGKSATVDLATAPKPFLGGKLIWVVLLALAFAVVVGGTVSLARIVSQRAAIEAPSIAEPTPEQIAAAQAELPAEVSFAEADPGSMPPPIPTAGGTAEGIFAGPQDVLGWIGEGMGLALKNVVILAVMVLLWDILDSLSFTCLAIPGVFVWPALLGGGMLVWLDVAKGKPAQIGNLFSCFTGNRIWRCMGIYWLTSAIVLVASIASFAIAYFVVTRLTDRLLSLELAGVLIMAALIFLAFSPAIFVISRLIWAMPLGTDRGLPTIEAIKTSWQLTGRVMSGFGTFLFLIALGFVGFLLSVLVWGVALLVLGGSLVAVFTGAILTAGLAGIFAEVPFLLAGLVFWLMWLALTNLLAMPILVGYRQMIGERRAESFGPAPQAFSGRAAGGASPVGGVIAAAAVILVILAFALFKVVSPDPFVGTWKLCPADRDGPFRTFQPIILTKQGDAYMVDGPHGPGTFTRQDGKFVLYSGDWRFEATPEGGQVRIVATDRSGQTMMDVHYERN